MRLELVSGMLSSGLLLGYSEYALLRGQAVMVTPLLAPECVLLTAARIRIDSTWDTPPC